MKVLRVFFVGTRTDSFDATLSLFRDVLGMEPAFAHPGWAGSRRCDMAPRSALLAATAEF